MRRLLEHLEDLQGFGVKEKRFEKLARNKEKFRGIFALQT